MRSETRKADGRSESPSQTHITAVPLETQAHLDHDVQHGPGVGDGHLGLFCASCLDDKVLRKAVGQDAPYSVGVQL